MLVLGFKLSDDTARVITRLSLLVYLQIQTMLVSVIAVLSLVAVSSAVEPKYEFVEEWQVWKSRHEKIYDTHLVELEKHLTWLSNKKYIEQHNANSHIFGFTLAMNKFGDMVRNSHAWEFSLQIFLLQAEAVVITEDFFPYRLSWNGQTTSQRTKLENRTRMETTPRPFSLNPKSTIIQRL